MKDKDDITHYLQILLEQCAYQTFCNNTIIYPDLEFKDTEPDNSDESEEEGINEDTA